ncbi:MAG: threonine dehydratase [Exilibacterium sp.]
MKLPTLKVLEQAANLVHKTIPPTPQICWPLLSQRIGAEVWLKHENHTPVGAFKIRGGLAYFHELKRQQPEINGVIAATRGNHGQSIAFAAQCHNLHAVVVVPHGNSREKNAAMRVRGVELIEHGYDFQEALEYAAALAEDRGLHFVPSFHQDLVTGVASYSLELFRAVANIDTLYVPIGLGSGICGAIAVRDALGLDTEIVGVGASAAPAYTESFNQRRPVSMAVAPTVADGMACRTPHPEAFELILDGVARIVSVDEDEIRSAMRHLFTDTHNVAEGAGAAALAAAIKEDERIQGQRIAVILTGGNVDKSVFADILSEDE